MSNTRSSRARRHAISTLVLLVGTAGCTDLEFLDANTCGNLVVEADLGEDCDGGSGCGAPGSAHECRFTCETEAKSCPEKQGYHCGADAVCRRPAGTFSSTGTNTTVTAQDMLVGDINADGCAEVIVGAKRSTTLHAFSSAFSTKCVEARQTLHSGRPDSGSESVSLAALVNLDSTEDTERLSLVSPTRSLYGDGLSMHFTSGSPTMSPVLFPRFLRPSDAIRTVAASMRKTGVIVLFEPSKDGMATDVTLIFDSQQAPVTFPKAYAGKVTDIAAVVAADVDPAVNSTPDMRCDEIIIAKRGDSKLELYKICTDSMTNGFAKLQNSQITLTNAAVRDKGARIFAADVNEDQITDIITNPSDKKVHIAYGSGDGRFHSAMPGPMPPMVYDQKANAINDPMADEALEEDGKVFVVLEFDPNHPGIDYYAPPCPPLGTFSSPNCAPVEGGCEAVVADIDADGDDDVIVSEGQGVDLIIHRQTNGTFNVSFLETTCPPHNLGTGDFDGDGVNDIAFFDQTNKDNYENKTTLSTSLSIVYGNAYAAPNPPVMSGRYEEASGLSVVHFGPPGTGSQIAITRAIGPMTEPRKSAVGVVEVGSERTVVAPYYITSDITGDKGFDTLTLVGQTPGHFGENAVPGLAVLTQSGTGYELWLVVSNQEAGTLRAQTKIETNEISCTDGCVLSAVPYGTSDNLLLLGNTSAAVYEVTTNNDMTLAFSEKTRFPLTRTFRQALLDKNPPRYFPRPLVADVDHDEITDVLVLASTGALVGFFGNADGGFTEKELIAAPKCWDTEAGWGKAGCGTYVAAQVDIDSDDFLDLVIAGSELPDVDKTTSIAAYKVQDRKLQLMDGISIDAEAIRLDTNFVALGAGDIDSDGVRDLIFMPSSNYFTVLRGLPVHE